MSNASRLQRQLQDIEWELSKLGRQLEDGTSPQQIQQAVRRIRGQFDEALTLMKRVKRDAS